MFVALGALPMWYLFFGAYALLACAIWILPSAYLLHWLGIARFAPLLVPLLCITLVATSQPEGIKAGAGVHFVVTALIWAIYTHFWSAPWRTGVPA